MVNEENILARVLTNYSKLGQVVCIDKIDAGLINKTYLVHGEKTSFILQEVSPIFEATVNDDSKAVSCHLALANIRSPKIMPTDAGQLFCRHDLRLFRALEYIPGQTFHKVISDKMAMQAGRVVGEFHAALITFDYTYKSLRPHGGNYSFHAKNLEKTLKAGAGHDYFSQIAPLAQTFLDELGAVTAGLVTTPRHAHGDPKISNILFDDEGRGICLIDFDTLSQTGWSLELADAMRSWCNKNPEDVLSARVDLNIAQLALKGYAEPMAKKITQAEISEFVTHTQAITLCLATRYLSDVINENYFAFDKNRFSRAADHNLLRAQSMFNLFHEFKKCARELRPMAQDLLL